MHALRGRRGDGHGRTLIPVVNLRQTFISLVTSRRCFERAALVTVEPVRIATWNVNSVKQRLPRLLPWLDERQPDVVCLQETKLADDAFAELLGDELARPRLRGRRARRGGVERRRDPLARRARGRGRRASPAARASRTRRRARCRRPAAASASSRSTCPTAARRTPTTTAYKLAWLAALRDDGRRRARARRSCCGDMNIAPTDDDVFDPDAYVGQTHVTPPERAALARAAGARPARRRPRPLAGRARLHLLGLPRRACSTRTSGCGSTCPRRRRRSPSACRRRGSTARRARARARATTRR